MTILWQETDPFGEVVVLTDERWQHIQARHPEMIGHMQELRDTIREPHVVYEDPDDPDADNFYRLCSTSLGRLYVRAVVMRADSSFVITAHFINRLKQGGKLKWIRR